MQEAKKALRKKMAEIAAGLSEEYRRKSDLKIFENFFTLPQYASAEKIFIYYSVGKEPDTVNIISKMLQDGKEVYIPLIACTREMAAGRIRSTENLPMGPLKIPKPLPGCERADKSRLDMIVIPGVAFDTAGGRLGRGGGYYDTYLQNTSAFKVGITREAFLCERIPLEAHDIAVDCVVTENGIKKSEAR